MISWQLTVVQEINLSQKWAINLHNQLQLFLLKAWRIPLKGFDSQNREVQAPCNINVRSNEK